jgi:predicted nucleic acid-binding protein
LRDLFDTFAFRSVISTVEVLGFTRITPNEKIYFETIFKTIPELSIVSQVAEKAIQLRQVRKMSLGDSLIASTALVYGLELCTNNTADITYSKVREFTVPHTTSKKEIDASRYTILQNFWII